ncbi:MAG: hypothetical protein HDS44_00035 [Bacteroides sp.]|nr:hypothetical protein [Bacteroides sp.]
MATISWGKPSQFQTTKSVDGAPAAAADWKDIETPKESTLQIVVTEGSAQTVTEEGGGIVDVRFNANTYELQFTEFVKKGKEPCFEDKDGIVEGEHAFRFLPEDDTCEGRQIDCSVVRVVETFTTAEGILRLHKAQGKKPKTGNTVKPYKKAAGGGS